MLARCNRCKVARAVLHASLLTMVNKKHNCTSNDAIKLKWRDQLSLVNYIKYHITTQTISAQQLYVFPNYCLYNLKVALFMSFVNSELKTFMGLLGGAQPVIPPNLYVYEHNSLGFPGNYEFKKVFWDCIFKF